MVFGRPQAVDTSDAEFKRLEEAKRTVPTPTRAGEVKGLMEQLQTMQERYAQRAKSVRDELERMDQIRDLLLRTFSRGESEVLEIIRERDRIIAGRQLQRDKRRRGLVGRDVGEGLAEAEQVVTKKLDELRNRARRVFGIEIPLSELETLTVRQRKLTQDELITLQRIAREAERQKNKLEELLTENGELLTREVQARRAFEEFAGVRFDTFAKVGVSGAQQAEGALKKTARDLRQFDRLLKLQRIKLRSGIGAMSAIIREANKARPGASAEQVENTVKTMGNITALVGLVTGIAAGANPIGATIGGAILALGLVTRLAGAIIEVFRKVTRRPAG